MINTDKAYLFGLIIGGGSFGNSTRSFAVNLPYKKWGAIDNGTTWSLKIAKDITGVIAPMFYNLYGLIAS